MSRTPRRPGRTRAASLLAAVFCLMTTGPADAGTGVQPTGAALIEAATTGTASASIAGSSAEAGRGGSQGRLSLGLGDHPCLVISNGDVRCWGNGSTGALGSGTALSRSAPAGVFGVHDAIAVSGGGGHVCALRASGQIACWGNNASGQRGTGNVDSSIGPANVTGISTAVAVAAGESHTCAVLADGTAWCWGHNNVGQLGQPASQNKPLPLQVPGIAGARSMAAGIDFSCALLADGTVKCWGDNSSSELGSNVAGSSTNVPTAIAGLSGVTAIAADYASVCALLAGGTVKCWGDNTYGQLGNDAALPGTAQATPTTVSGITGAVAITAGDGHACALLASGQARCWGQDNKHQLGDGSPDTTSHPVAVAGVTAIQIAAGQLNTCALLVDGSVSCWGSATYGIAPPMSDPDSNPHQIFGNLSAGLVTTGAFHTCAITAVRTVQCWGSNGSGQLGIGNVAGPVATPTTVAGLSNVISLSAGSYHTCAVLMDGTARCWGDNAKGELGNGDSGTGHLSKTPVKVVGLAGAESISGGGDHTCAVKTDHTVWCWGNNADGQVGNAELATVQPNAAPVNITNVHAVSAGSGHTCAVTLSDNAWCWGAGSSGQLGDGSSSRSATPLEVKNGQTNTALLGVAEVVARYAYSCALTYAGGLVQCWGFNGYDSVGSADTAQALPVSTALSGTEVYDIGPSSNHGVHTCAVNWTGAVICWGANDQGQLGRGTTTPKETADTFVAGLTGVAQVSVGFTDSCSLLLAGTIKCWGDNSSDQLGSTAGTPQSSPVTAAGYSAANRLTAIDAGASHTCALVTDGTARCWGNNGSGRLGDGTTTNRHKPAKVSGLTGATAISAGGAHTCALLLGGTVKCWGSNSHGQIGDSSTTGRPTPTTVSGLSGVVAISTGGTHTCALLSNGTVKCWGLNASGQVGDGTTSDRHVPVTVKANATTTLTNVVAISAGTAHTCALLATGVARCWGAGGNGRLGNGSTGNRPFPVAVSGVTSATAAKSRFTSISAGGSHTCARVAGGTVKCWGAGADGRLGNGAAGDQLTPVAVSSLTLVAAVSAGGSHACALLAAGTVKCWGLNSSGQLGNGSTSPSSTPVAASSLTGAVSISAGGSHTAALLVWGAPRVWGLNGSGQVGDGTTTNRLTPHAIWGF